MGGRVVGKLEMLIDSGIHGRVGGCFMVLRVVLEFMDERYTRGNVMGTCDRVVLCADPPCSA